MEMGQGIDKLDLLGHKGKALSGFLDRYVRHAADRRTDKQTDMCYLDRLGCLC